MWLVVWAVLLLGALVILGVLGWRVFTKAKAVFTSVADAVADAEVSGEAARNWHLAWTQERAEADDRLQEALAESARPGPRRPLPALPTGNPPKG